MRRNGWLACASRFPCIMLGSMKKVKLERQQLLLPVFIAREDLYCVSAQTVCYRCLRIMSLSNASHVHLFHQIRKKDIIIIMYSIDL